VKHQTSISDFQSPKDVMEFKRAAITFRNLNEARIDQGILAPDVMGHAQQHNATQASEKAKESDEMARAIGTFMKVTLGTSTMRWVRRAPLSSIRNKGSSHAVIEHRQSSNMNNSANRISDWDFNGNRIS
jgi:hypothetical protein